MRGIAGESRSLALRSTRGNRLLGSRRRSLRAARNQHRGLPARVDPQGPISPASPRALLDFDDAEAFALIGRPAASEYAPSFAADIALVPEEEILEVLTDQLRDAVGFLQGIPEKRAEFRYAPGKWSVAEVVGHVIDSERVYGFRALTFARGDSSPLPGFDQDDYAREGRVAGISPSALAREFGHVRRSHLLLLERLAPSDWRRAGVANGARMTVRALAYAMAGHVRHHLGLLKERYFEV